MTTAEDESENDKPRAIGGMARGEQREARSKDPTAYSRAGVYASVAELRARSGQPEKIAD